MKIQIGMDLNVLRSYTFYKFCIINAQQKHV